MDTIKDFTSLMEEILQFFEDLIQLEEEKLRIVTIKDMEGLDRCMKTEQAYTMKLRGLDKRREKMQETLFQGKKTFHEILELCSPSDKPMLTSLFERLQEKISVFEDLRAQSRMTMEIRLEDINALLAARQATGKPYSKTGQRQSTVKNTSFTSKKV